MAYKVCLDAGHFGKYNRSPVVPEYYESERMWKLTQLQAAALRKRGVEVVLTRDDQSRDLALTTRGRKSAGCDVFVSNHSNAANKKSVDYVVAYVPLNGSGTELGKLLAKCVADTMGTKQTARTATRRGSNGDYYGVIRGAVAVGTPGIILEHSFHTNPEATEWLLSDENLAILAEREADVILAYLKAKKPVQANFEPFKVRVTITDLNIRTEASASSKSKGYIKPGVYTIIEEKNGWGRLKSKIGWIKLSYTTRLPENHGTKNGFC